MAYVTVAQLQQYLGTERDRDNLLLEDMISYATAAIEAEVGFSFEIAADSTRYFDAVRDVDGLTLYFDTWCYSITTLTNGDTTVITSTYYVKEPRNGTPSYAVTLKSSSGYVWEASSTTDDPENAITVVGKWGWSVSAPTDIQRATLRLAAWYYRQRDNSTDIDRPIITEGVTILPGQMPVDVLRALDRYRWRT